MQRSVHAYLKALEAGDADRAAALFISDVFNFDPSSGHIQSIVLVYDTHPVRAVVENKYP